MNNMKEYFEKQSIYNSFRAMSQSSPFSLSAIEAILSGLESIQAQDLLIWNPIKVKKITPEDKKALGYDYDDSVTYMWDCMMPDDQEEVLVQTSFGIFKTEYSTGYGFDDFGDDVIAWTHLPEKYECK